MTRAVLDRLIQERTDCVAFVDRTLDQAEQRGGDMSDTEQESLKRQRERIEKLDPQIKDLEEFDKLRQADRAGAEQYRPGSGRTEIVPAGGQQKQTSSTTTNPRAHKYETVGHVIVDHIRAFDGDETAADRLESNDLHYSGKLAEKRVQQVTGDNPSLIPDNFYGSIISEVDAARPFMESQGVGTLSDKPGKKWSRPRITQHVQVGEQLTEFATLASRKMLLDEIEFTKQVAGGFLDISRQDIDWSDPSAWNAIEKDFQEQYAIQTETMAVAKFMAGLDATGEEVVGDTTIAGWARALYKAAAEVYGNVGSLPDVIYCALDMWVAMGPITDTGRLIFSGGANSIGDGAGIKDFGGNLFDLPRVVVPKMTSGTIAVGRKSKFECYEQKLGFLSVILPSVLGVQLAYGGYVANGYVSTGGFARVINATAG